MTIEKEGYFIVGLTRQGNKFRPSDWVERIAGVFAHFDAHRRLRYSPLVTPMLRVGLSGLFVASSLASVDPAGFQFVMEFADRYQLQIESADQAEVEHSHATLPHVA
jgi:hypothetical protein